MDLGFWWGTTWRRILGVKEDWWGMYRRYLRTRHWQKVRQMALRHDHYRCTQCGSQGSAANPLQCDHLNYRNLWREGPHDVQILCRSCHERKTAQSRQGAHWL